MKEEDNDAGDGNDLGNSPTRSSKELLQVDDGGGGEEEGEWLRWPTSFHYSNFFFSYEVFIFFLSINLFSKGEATTSVHNNNNRKTRGSIKKRTKADEKWEDHRHPTWRARSLVHQINFK